MIIGLFSSSEKVLCDSKLNVSLGLLPRPTETNRPDTDLKMGLLGCWLEIMMSMNTVNEKNGTHAYLQVEAQLVAILEKVQHH